MEYETFLLYYVCWHEGEFSILEMRRQLIDDIGKGGIKIAIAEFKEVRSKRMKENNLTYYDFLKEIGELDK